MDTGKLSALDFGCCHVLCRVCFKREAHSSGNKVARFTQSLCYRRARTTVRFAAFHSAVGFDLSPKSATGSFQPAMLSHAQSFHKSFSPTLRGIVMRWWIRCRRLAMTGNSNSASSSRASCQNQARQLGPPQYVLR